MDYPDFANPDLLDRIPLTARVVLDVGCAGGALGADYKRRNPTARVFGIERDRRAATAAARRLDQVFVADLDFAPTPFAEVLGNGQIDALIYGDVLEHLREPAEVLRQHLPYLTEDGLVLICLPNLDHASFVEHLLRGTWDYAPHGLLDRTHLRWFTRETAERMLQTIGLSIVQSAPRIFNRPATAAVSERLRPALRGFGIDADAQAERARPLQFVWAAARRPPERLKIVSTMLKPIGGVSHLRVTEPMAALAAEPSLDARVMDNGAELPDGEERPGIFIFHRPLLAGEEGLAQVRDLLGKGWLVLCEFDDNPDHMRALQRPDVLNFRAVHAVQTSTEALAALFRLSNPEVAVFPNAIARLPEPANFRDPQRLTLLFAGLNRENEWPDLLGALNNAARKAADRLAYVIVGDRALYEQLDTPNKRLLPLCSYDTYKSLLSGCEISFMPLRLNDFNRCKSDLKFIEAGAHRAVALASPTVYADSIEDGRTGIIFRTAQELEQSLLRLVVDPRLGLSIGEAARAYVIENRMLAGQVAARVRWYHALWERREELHANLLARVPELAA